MNSEAVREIQHALRTLSFSEPSLPPLVVDGRYGYETRRAVARFQQLYSLPESGEVDPVTWDRLREAYQAALTLPPSPLKVFPHRDFVLRVGESDEIVPVIKAILTALSRRYANLVIVDQSPLYDSETAQVIRYLRRLHDLEESDLIDIEVWELLAALYADRPDVRGRDGM